MSAPQAQWQTPGQAIPNDRYHDIKELAKLCTRFIDDMFKPRSEPDGQLPLYQFIAHVLYRTRHLPASSNIAFATLMYAERLKIKLRSSPKARMAKGLFFSAYMVAAKFLIDEKKSQPMPITWAHIGSILFEVEEINAMERGVLESLDWRTAVDGRRLAEFIQFVKEQYNDSGPRATYQIIDPSIPFTNEYFNRQEPNDDIPLPVAIGPGPPPSPFIPPLLLPSP